MERAARLVTALWYRYPNQALRLYYYYVFYFGPAFKILVYNIYLAMSVPYASQRRYNWSWNPFSRSRAPTTKRRFRRRRRQRGMSFPARVKRVMASQQEKKYIATSFAAISQAIAGTSSIHFLTGITQGDDVNERLGNEVRLSKIRIEGSVGTDPTAIADTQYRMVLVQGVTNIEGVAPTILEIFATDSPDSLRELVGIRNYDFKILWDNKFILREFRPPVAGRVSRVNVAFIHAFRNGGLKLTYDANTSGIADAEKNHLFLILMTNQANTFQPAFNGTVRITYQD